MEKLLHRFTVPDNDPVPLLAALVDLLRPARAADANSARHKLHALCYLLGTRRDLRQGLRRGVLTLLDTRRQLSLYAGSGMLPHPGFFSEWRRRMARRVLPDVVDPDRLADVIGCVFHRPDDEIWVREAGDEAWVELLEALRFDEVAPGTMPARPLQQMVQALRVISSRLGGAGLDPEFLRVAPDLGADNGAFIAQGLEMNAWLARLEQHRLEPGAPFDDEKRLLARFDQCRDSVERIRRRARREGTSLALIHRLQGLQQLIRRARQLIEIVAVARDERNSQAAYPTIATLFVELVRAECRKNDIASHFRRNLELLALRATENASQSGERDLGETREAYFAGFRSALIGGFVIAFVAGFMIVLGQQDLAPPIEVLAGCLNYGLGFVLIHLLHGSVAAKQAATTAKAIAAGIGENSGRLRDPGRVAGRFAHASRTQWVAILGNIGMALPISILISLAAFQATGTHFLTPENAAHLLGDQDPVHSASLWYAAIAGVCLFLAGPISGYYDNLCAYARIPERLLQLRWPKRLFGAARLRRVAACVDRQFGALAGDFSFGLLLGVVWGIGALSGLPVDIRHVAFASAYLGYALAALDFQPDAALFALACAGVAAIGLTNLLVGFSLALHVALRARQASFEKRGQLLRTLSRQLRHAPRDFFLPPKKTSSPS